MKTAKLLAVLVITAMLLSLAVPVAAAPPDNPGPPPRELLLREFIHYRGEANPGGNPDVLAALASTATYSDPSYVWEGHHWPDSVVLSPHGVEFWVNPENSGDTTGTFADAVAVSTQTWEDAPSTTWGVEGHYMNFTYSGITSVENSSLTRKTDGINVVTWDRLRPTGIAVTYIWYWSDTLEIVECDMAMNSRLSWATDESPDAFDVQNIATHEFGHFYMLGDLYDDSDTELTMYGYSVEGEIKKRILGYGDELGTRAIYPGAGIYGTVTDFDTGDVIEGAAVSTDVGGYTDTTDANGFYCLDGVAPSSYSITASAEGYGSVSKSVTVSSTEDIKLLDFALSKAVEPVAVSIGPNQTGSGSAGDVVPYTFTVSNDGTGDDVFDITTSSTEGWTVSLYKADGVTALLDTDEDSTADTGTLAPGGTADIVAKVAIPDTATAGTEDITTVIATSSVDIAISDSATATTTVVGEVVVHVSFMDMWYTTAGPNIFVYTKVQVKDSAGNPISGATVFVETDLGGTLLWSGSGDTNGNDGTVTFKLKSRQTGIYTSTVMNVVKDGWTYEPSDNVETSDSIIVP